MYMYILYFIISIALVYNIAKCMQHLCKEPKKQTENTHNHDQHQNGFSCIRYIYSFLYKGELPKTQVVCTAHYCRDLLILILPSMVFSMYAMICMDVHDGKKKV